MAPKSKFNAPRSKDGKLMYIESAHFAEFIQDLEEIFKNISNAKSWRNSLKNLREIFIDFWV